jgi:hypothetical protein
MNWRWPNHWKTKLRPTAVMSEASFGARRSAPVGTRSAVTLINAHTAITATRVRSSSRMPTTLVSVTPNQLTRRIAREHRPQHEQVAVGEVDEHR